MITTMNVTYYQPMTNIIQTLNQIFKSSSDQWGGHMMKTTAKLMATFILISLITYSTCKVIYSYGYMFGSYIHYINDELTKRLNNNQSNSIEPWQLQQPQLQLPKFLTPYYGGTSVTTAVTPAMTVNLPLSATTKPGPATEDQKKEAGITNTPKPSKQSASSQRSKQSEKQSNFTAKPLKKQRTARSTTTSAGVTSPLNMPRSMPRTTQRKGRTTAEEA